MPAERIHTMFLSLGLRHMVVVDGVFRVVGLITRKELDYAAGQGSWRRNRRASSPRRYTVIEPAGSAHCLQEFRAFPNQQQRQQQQQS